MEALQALNKSNLGETIMEIKSEAKLTTLEATSIIVGHSVGSSYTVSEGP